MMGQPVFLLPFLASHDHCYTLTVHRLQSFVQPRFFSEVLNWVFMTKYVFALAYVFIKELCKEKAWKKNLHFHKCIRTKENF